MVVGCKKFRFDFSKHTIDLLSVFSKEHCDEKCKQFQCSWRDWINKDNIKKTLDEECETLKALGFEGDVYDKMYKSARYYYKKRQDKKDKYEEKQSTVHTNRFSSNFLKLMDNIIKSQLNEDVKKNNGIERSQIEFFDNYCNIHRNEIVMELRDIKERKGQIPEDIKEKLKKTYKNRFYKNRMNVVKG